MRDTWFDDYAAGAFLPESTSDERQVGAYAQGYADGVGQAAAKLRDERWEGYFEAMADVAQAEVREGPCSAWRAVRPRPLYGRRPR